MHVDRDRPPLFMVPVSFPPEPSTAVEGGVETAPGPRPLSRLDGPGLAVADEHHPADAGHLAALRHLAVGQLHERAGGDVQAGLDDAIVTEADPDAGVGPEEAPLADRDLLGA